MVTGLRIDQSLFEVLTEADLQGFRKQICVDLQLTKLDHFDHVKDRDLQNIGLSLPAIRRLRESISEKRRDLRRHPDRAMRTVIVPFDESGPSTEISQPGTSSIKKDQIKLLETIGEGTFAVVKRAIWTKTDGRRLDVAVKILRDASPLVIEELQKEVNSLQKLEHTNLIRLYGVVSDATWMVFELCEGGSLLDRLRDRKKPALLVGQMLDFSQQIAKGMTYLEVKHCVHRDLASRNILLSVDEKTVKICDFGLMRSLEENERLYIMNPQKRVPFAWCPPESLRFRQFSHASDVWAMGVLMWEIYSFGEDPWAGLRGRDVLERIDAGERLPKPKYCSQQVYDLMDLCWKANPDARPKFKMLWGHLKQANYSVAEVREAHPSMNDQQLELRVGDRVQIIENTGVTWFGQSERTRCFGNFQRSVVFVRSVTEPTREGSSKITRPIAGSFIHTGHGDIREGKGWGSPQYIDKLYLSNPVLGQPNAQTQPQIIESILPPPHKSKPEPPRKPPVNLSSGAEGIPLSPMRDPFDDLNLSRASRQVAPSPILVAPTTQSRTPMSQFVPTRVAPAPPSSQPKVNSNGSAVPRPLSTSIPQGPSSSRSANNTPPMIKADAFMNVRNAANKMDGMVIIPRSPHQNGGITLLPEPGPSSRAPAGIGHGQSILNELQSKLGKGSGNETVRLRPTPSVNETPVFVHSQMPTMRPLTAIPTLGPDPFEVPSSVRNALERDRYNEIIEKNAHKPAPTIPNHQSHSSSTPQMGSNNILQPSPLPSSARITNPPHPNQFPSLQNATHSLTPIDLQRISMHNPPSISNMHLQQQRPMSQVLIPTPAPIIQKPLTPQVSSQSSTMVRQPINNVAASPALTPIQNIPNQVNIQKQREIQSASTSKPSTTPTVSKDNTQPSISTPVLQPTKVVLPPSKSTVIPQENKTKEEQRRVNSSSQKEHSDQRDQSKSTRRHTTEIDISALLPPPSALFFGNGNGNATPAAQSSQQNKTLNGTSNKIEIESQPKQIKTVIPGTTPSSSTLQTVLPSSNGSSNNTPNPINPQLSKPSSMSSVPAQTVVVPKTTAPPLLPSEPLVPTPLYPKISTIAPPLNPSPPRAPAFSQDQVDAIMAQYSRPQSTYNSVPLFSAQQSLGHNGYGGYGSPIQGMGAYGGFGSLNGSGIYGGYGLNDYSSMGSRYPISSSVYPSLSDSSRPLAIMGPLRPPTPPPPSSTHVQHSEEIISTFDPLAELYSQSTLPRENQSTGSGVTRAEQMEILYKEASFTERANCDRMVGICGGNVEEALKKLKINYLVDTGMASDRAIAISALEAVSWNLNAAAEAIFTR